jgi:hypothetical protein
MKRQRNNNRCLVHDSVNHPRLRSSSLPHGPDLGAQYACPLLQTRAAPQKIFHFPVRFPLPNSALLGGMNHSRQDCGSRVATEHSTAACQNSGIRRSHQHTGALLPRMDGATGVGSTKSRIWGEHPIAVARLTVALSYEVAAARNGFPGLFRQPRCGAVSMKRHDRECEIQT